MKRGEEEAKEIYVIDKPWLLSRFWVYSKLYHSLVTFHCLTSNKAELCSFISDIFSATQCYNECQKITFGNKEHTTD